MSELIRIIGNIAIKANNIVGIVERYSRDRLVSREYEFNLKNVCKGNLNATVM